MPSKVLQRILFWLILVSYALVGGLFAIQVPAWQAPDEPAHYNLVAQLVTDGAYPVIEQGDWDSAYLETIKSNQFAPAMLGQLATVQYEDHQPPLYYVLQAPVYLLTDGNLTALRMASVVIGSVVVMMAFLIGREVFPTQPQIALGTMALVAFIPQHVHILASVNNDVLAEAVIAVALWLMVRYVKGRDVPVWLLGVVLGIGLITKTTTYFLLLPALIVIFMRWMRQPAGARKLSRVVHLWAVLGLIALVIGGVWWLRNIATYGTPDFLGLAAHDAVVVGQPRTADLIAEVGVPSYLNRLMRTTMRSYWGQFGWMAQPLDGRIYLAIQVMLIFSLTGLILRLFIVAMRPQADSGSAEQPNSVFIQGQLWILMGIVLLLSLLAFIYYNTQFVQFQGRYLYPGLIPLALMLVLGVDAWRYWLIGWIRGTRWLVVLPFWAFALVDVYVLTRYIVPGLSAG